MNVQQLTIYDTEFLGPEEQNKTYRLGKQLYRIWNVMKDGRWRTLGEIEAITGDPQASISAQLRNLAKEKFGRHTLDKNYRSDGLYEYQIIRNPHSSFIDPELSE